MVDAGQGNFDSARATSFYRTMWLAFLDLYGIDFDHITDDEAASLDRLRMSGSRYRYSVSAI
jgi:hypothetical protein